MVMMDWIYLNILALIVTFTLKPLLLGDMFITVFTWWQATCAATAALSRLKPSSHWPKLFKWLLTVGWESFTDPRETTRQEFGPPLA